MNFNTCSHFLPQLIGINKFVEGFKNCYICDVEDDEPFKHIYILMEKDSSLLDIYPFTKSKREVNEGNLYKIAVNERFEEDLKLFYKGEYSKISSEAKQVIVDNCGILPENSLSYHVLYKTNSRRKFLENYIGEELSEEAELMSVLNLDKNIYGY